MAVCSCERLDRLLLTGAQRAGRAWCEWRVTEQMIGERLQEESKHRDGEGVAVGLQALPDEAVGGGHVVRERGGILGEAQRPVALVVEERS